jgi:hypothetical protein
VTELEDCYGGGRRGSGQYDYYEDEYDYEYDDDRGDPDYENDQGGDYRESGGEQGQGQGQGGFQPRSPMHYEDNDYQFFLPNPNMKREQEQDSERENDQGQGQGQDAAGIREAAIASLEAEHSPTSGASVSATAAASGSAFSHSASTVTAGTSSDGAIAPTDRDAGESLEPRAVIDESPGGGLLALARRPRRRSTVKSTDDKDKDKESGGGKFMAFFKNPLRIGNPHKMYAQTVGHPVERGSGRGGGGEESVDETAEGPALSRSSLSGIFGGGRSSGTTPKTIKKKKSMFSAFSFSLSSARGADQEKTGKGKGEGGVEDEGDDEGVTCADIAESAAAIAALEDDAAATKRDRDREREGAQRRSSNGSRGQSQHQHRGSKGGAGTGAGTGAEENGSSGLAPQLLRGTSKSSVGSSSRSCKSFQSGDGDGDSDPAQAQRSLARVGSKAGLAVKLGLEAVDHIPPPTPKAADPAELGAGQGVGVGAAAETKVENKVETETETPPVPGALLINGVWYTPYQASRPEQQHQNQHRSTIIDVEPRPKRRGFFVCFSS